MNILLIVILVIATAVAIYAVLLHNKKIKDKDGDFIPDAVEEVVEEVMDRYEVIKEEVADVKKAVKKVANQAGDVVDAAKGKKRKGRPKKKK
jgi:DNA-binding ferritin-like protein